MKDKKRLRNRLVETKETQKLNVMWDPGLYLKKEKYINGKTGEMNKVYSLVNIVSILIS